MKLFWKLFCSMVSVTLLACAVGGFVLIDGQFRAALDQEVQALYVENDMLRFVLARELEGRSVARREELSRLTGSMLLSSGGRTAAFRLSGGDGTVLGGTGLPYLERGALTGALAEDRRGWRLVRVSEGIALLHGASALSLGDETLWLENCRDVSALFVQRDGQYRSFSLVMLALTAGVGALSLLVSHVILRPLERLSAATRKMAEGELAQRVAVTSGDELGQLSEDFNAMAGRLEEQMAQLTAAARRERDFTAAFAHEIKTPLTSIIGYADLLLSREAPPDQVRDSAGYIFREGRRLEALSGKLMELIVLDRRDFPLRPVSLRAFLERTGNALEPDLMETVCLNLLDNARKATPPGGSVALTGRGTEGGGCVIQVTDTGKGIPEEELGRIAEPFYMVDKSRARAQGGAGLGLALCKRIAQLHGGTLNVHRAPGMGTTAEIRLHGGGDA